MTNTHGGARKGSGRKKKPRKVISIGIDDIYGDEFGKMVYELRDKFLKEKSKTDNKMNIETGKTQRGFAIVEFADRYGYKCSLQKSSLATEDAIWFGIDDPKPQIMVSDAHKLGITTPKNNGWVPYCIPEQVLISTRMHLTQQQVIELLPILQKFAETGEL